MPDPRIVYFEQPDDEEAFERSVMKVIEDLNARMSGSTFVMEVPIGHN